MSSKDVVFQECKLVIVKVYIAIDLNERAAVHYLHYLRFKSLLIHLGMPIHDDS